MKRVATINSLDKDINFFLSTKIYVEIISIYKKNFF